MEARGSAVDGDGPGPDAQRADETCLRDDFSVATRQQTNEDGFNCCLREDDMDEKERSCQLSVTAKAPARVAFGILMLFLMSRRAAADPCQP